MAEIYEKLQPFDVKAEPPRCERWKNHMPASRDPETYAIYIKARRQWRSKRDWQHSRQENVQILAAVNLAAERGDWGAISLMSHFYLNGLGILDSNNAQPPDPKKAVDLMFKGANAGQAWGFYDLGVAFEHGYAGLRASHDAVWRLYLKAAQLGSPDAQMVLAEAYEEVERRDAAELMMLCAYQQGHGPASHELGLRAEVNEKDAAALKYYQDGVRYGDKNSASALYMLFKDGKFLSSSDISAESLDALHITKDPDRRRRYEAIRDAFDANPDLKFPLIDKFVPLPPIPLPAWKGIEDAIGPQSDDNPTY